MLAGRWALRRVGLRALSAGEGCGAGGECGPPAGSASANPGCHRGSVPARSAGSALPLALAQLPRLERLDLRRLWTPEGSLADLLAAAPPWVEYWVPEDG